MRKLLSVSGIILALWGVTFSQSPENSSCPAIWVSGPLGIVNPGEIARYVANVDTKGNQLDLGYQWSVSAGEIVSGQGTTTLEVKTAEMANLTVTVDILGLPSGCVNMASETTGCGLRAPDARKIDEFAGPFSDSTRSVLDKVAHTVNDSPYDQLYILSGHLGEQPVNRVLTKETDVIDYLQSRGVERSRISLVEVSSQVELLQFWQVPPGATPPDTSSMQNASPIPIRDWIPFYYVHNISVKEQLPQFDYLAINLREAPHSNLYVVIRYWKGATKRTIRNNEAQIHQYFERKWADIANRVKIVNGPSDELSSINYVIVPVDSVKPNRK